MVAGTLAILTLLVVAGPLSGAPAYPVKVGPSGRYLVDQNGVPFLVAGESPQAMIGNLSEAEAEMFLANREAHGFNTVLIDLLCVTYTGCRDDGSTFARAWLATAAYTDAATRAFAEASWLPDPAQGRTTAHETT